MKSAWKVFCMLEIGVVVLYAINLLVCLIGGFAELPRADGLILISLLYACPILVLGLLTVITYLFSKRKT